MEGDVTNVRQPNIDSLTGLRFIAALTIALGHTASVLDIITFIGMPLFFTLSGFVIHYVYSEEFSRSWGTAVTKFGLARFSRIYPLYLFLFLFALVSTPLGQYLFDLTHIGLFVPYLFFCYTWWPFAADGHLLGDWHYGISWSIPTEMFFYFAYGLVFYKFGKVKSFETCLVALVSFCVLAYVWFYVLFISRDIWEPTLLSYNPNWVARTNDFNNSFYRWFLYLSPYSRIFEFVAGCLTCQLFLLARRRPRMPRIVLETFAWLPVGAIAAVLIYLRFQGWSEPWLAFGNHSWTAYLVTLHMNFLLAPMCCLMIFSFAIGSPSLGRVLGSAVPQFFGDISYSIYLSHPLIETFSYILIGTFSEVVRVPTTLVLIPILAWALYTTVELPAKRLLRGWGARYLPKPRTVSPSKPVPIGSNGTIPASTNLTNALYTQ